MRVALLCLVLCGCGGIPSVAGSAFENDADGWTLTGNGDIAVPTLMSTGGNPGGHICGKDAKDGDTWYFVAPSKFLGNVTKAAGKRITWDIKQGTIFNQIRGRDLVLNGGGLALTYNIRSAPGLEWTPYSVRLDDTSGWLVENGGGSTGAKATSDDIASVLRNLTSLRIRGEFVDGPDDTACLDNMYLGTD